MALADLLQGSLWRTPPIFDAPGRPSGMTPPYIPGQPQEPSPTPQPRWMQSLNSPLSQIGMRLLANSRDQRGNPTPIGQALGNSVLGYQQQQQSLQEEDLRRKYMEAQIARMQQPEQTQEPAQIQLLRALQKDPTLLETYQKMNPSGQPSLPSSIQIAQYLDNPNIPESQKKIIREQLKRDGVTPSYQFLQGGDGTWYSGDTRTGRTAPTGVNAPAKPTGESQIKQDVGIKNLGLAVDEYVKALPSLSMLGYLNPAEHARIGTVYNNMMLQAKEAYNLGVLNGPDFEILQKVVTDPMTLKGAVTSKESLAKQAQELQRIMNKMRGNVNPRGVANEARGNAANPDDPLGIR